MKATLQSDQTPESNSHSGFFSLKNSQPSDTSNFQPLVNSDQGFRQIPSRRGRSSSRSSKTSYAILLFDQDGNFIVLENPVSYAWANFLHVLCSSDFSNYENLFEEFTLDELRILRDCWTEDGLDKMIQIYMQKAFPENSKQSVREILEQKFKKCRDNMRSRWLTLLQIINLDKLPSETFPRIYDLPKTHSTDKKKWQNVRDHFRNEVKVQLPSNTSYRKWIPVSYYSNNDIRYDIEMLIGKCDHFEIPTESRARWSSLEDLEQDKVYFVPAMKETIQSAWNSL